MATEQRAAGEHVLKAADGSDFLSGGVGDDGGQRGGCEALLRGGVQAVEVNELEKKDGVVLGLSLRTKAYQLKGPAIS